MRAVLRTEYAIAPLEGDIVDAGYEPNKRIFLPVEQVRIGESETCTHLTALIEMQDHGRDARVVREGFAPRSQAPRKSTALVFVSFHFDAARSWDLRP
jgi:hypothetical protein